MMFMVFALFFCVVCGVAGALVLTAPQRAVRREIRLTRARCAMLDAVKELDERIFAKKVQADSMIVDFQRFAWYAKDRNAVFTVRSFLPILWCGMAQYAAAVAFRDRITREMSRVPRLNHAKTQFLQSYYQYMECRHPVMTFLLGHKNRWMYRRYCRLAPARKKELVEMQRRAPVTNTRRGYISQLLRLGPLQDLPSLQAA